MADKTASAGAMAAKKKHVAISGQKKKELESMMGKPTPEEALKKISDVEFDKATQRKDALRKEQPDLFKSAVRALASGFPNLGRDLKRAEMGVDAVSFITRALLLSLAVTLVVGVAGFAISMSFEIPQAYVLVVIPLTYIGIFFWILQYPRLKIGAKARDLDKDVLFAGRDMLIALKSGVPLFNAMANVTKNYGAASTEFAKIVEKIESGVPAEVALQEASDMNTSRPFRQILLQIITSMRSGSDVALALGVVLNQISQEQVIALKRYGQKLNPLTMFYMLVGIILPSLGIAIGIILTSFVSLKIDFTILLIVLAVLAIMQYIFLALILSSRPQFEV